MTLAGMLGLLKPLAFNRNKFLFSKLADLRF